MNQMGFSGQFGGGFISNGNLPPQGGQGVTYTQPFPRTQPRDKSGRKSYGMWSDHSGLNLRRRSR